MTVPHFGLREFDCSGIELHLINWSADTVQTTGTYTIEGRFVELKVPNSQYCLIEGSGTILVLQYSVGGEAGPAEGDPAMIIVPAIKQYCSSYSLPLIQHNDNSFTFTHYMNVFIPAQWYQTDQIFLDNQLLSSYHLNFRVFTPLK